MYQKIAVPLDGSELAECVLPHVESIAKGCQAQTVILLRVVEPFFMPSGMAATAIEMADPRKVDAANKQSAKEYLETVASRLKSAGLNAQSVVLMSEALGSGNIARSIAEYAAKNNIELVVIATHGRSGVSRWVWGSVTDRILRSACVPVFMIRAPGCIPGV